VQRPPTAKELAAFGISPEQSSTLVKEANLTSASVGPNTTPPPKNSHYAGDNKEDSDYVPADGFYTMSIASPALLLVTINKHFREGGEELYEWQKEQLEEIAQSNTKATLHNPYKLALCAANGSGKDYIIVAPTVVWMSLVNIRCLTIITSSSGAQLTAQTENYIRNLCAAFNEHVGFEAFRIRQRYIKCLITGSEIRLFATDEAGKAEGYHPLEPNARMVIIINEAKNVSEEIFGALRRCTGYTHWLNISTPGEPKGSFHKACTEPRLGYRFRRVTYRECRTNNKSHISEPERIADEVDLGTTSALYRSKWLAEFTSLDVGCIVPLDHINACLSNQVPKAFSDWPLRIGMDLSAGGDETVLIATRGNTLVKEVFFQERDTTLVAARLDIELKELLGDNKKHEFIFGDDGGIGKSIIDMLRQKGWEIRRVVNQARAIRPDQYGNRGAEMWYLIKRLAEERLIRFDECSNKLCEQLYTRICEKRAGRIWLEPKPKAKSEGRPSPDRADAFVLSLCGLSVSDFMTTDKKALKEESDTVSIPRGTGQKFANAQEAERFVDDLAFEGKDLEQINPARGNGRRCHGSLHMALKGTTNRTSKFEIN
jgi:phage terminase large subunit